MRLVWYFTVTMSTPEHLLPSPISDRNGHISIIRSQVDREEIWQW